MTQIFSLSGKSKATLQSIVKDPKRNGYYAGYELDIEEGDIQAAFFEVRVGDIEGNVNSVPAVSTYGTLEALYPNHDVILQGGRFMQGKEVEQNWPVAEAVDNVVKLGE